MRVEFGQEYLPKINGILWIPYAVACCTVHLLFVVVRQRPEPEGINLDSVHRSEWIHLESSAQETFALCKKALFYRGVGAINEIEFLCEPMVNSGRCLCGIIVVSCLWLATGGWGW